MAPQNQVRIIRVKVDAGDTKGLKEIQSSVAALNTQLKTVSGTLNLFQNAFSTILGASFLGVGISQITQLADSYSLLTDKLKVLTGSSEGAERAFRGIQELARENKTSIDGVGTVYSRLSQSLSDVGASSDQVLKISDLLIKSFRISGATTAEATAGTIQLSQGLATGALRGQELRSVLESNVVIGELLATSLGKNRGQLIKLGEAGAITSEVFINALFGAQERLQKQSDTLGITFEQVGLKIKNELLVAVGELSKDLGIASTLSKGVDYLIEKLPALAAAFTAVAIPLTLIAGNKLVIFLGQLITKITPLTAILSLLATTAFLVADNFNYLTIEVKKLIQVISIGLNTAIISVVDNIENKLGNIKAFSNLRDSALESLGAAKNSLKELDELSKKPGAFVGPPKPPVSIPEFDKAADKVVKLKDVLAALNKEYNTGKISLEEYYGRLSNFELSKLNKEMKEGKINLEQYNIAIEELARNDMQRLFETGAISLKTFNDSINSDKMEDLNKKFKEGKINIEEYNRALIGLSNNFNGESALVVGTSDFLNRIGTVSQNVAGLITDTFSRLEDSLFKFIETGKFSFKEFATEVIKDINRIILRALIVRPLAQGILGAIGGGGGAALPQGTSFDYGSAPNSAMAAKGFAPTGSGVSMFAQGGVVNGATPFTYGGNKRGIMGESGPEAIMPLKRSADGSLGVKAEGMGGSNVTVNIINQSGAEVQQQESSGPDGQRVLDILILTKVKEGFARGDFDRTFQQSYGLRRRGN
jgi:tape measure domain-containing protein